MMSVTYHVHDLHALFIAASRSPTPFGDDRDPSAPPPPKDDDQLEHEGDRGKCSSAGLDSSVLLPDTQSRRELVVVFIKHSG